MLFDISTSLEFGRSLVIDEHAFPSGKDFPNKNGQDGGIAARHRAEPVPKG